MDSDLDKCLTTSQVLSRLTDIMNRALSFKRYFSSYFYFGQSSGRLEH
jgi:hypothetical protein